MKKKSIFVAGLVILTALCLAAGVYAQPIIGGPEGMVNLKRLDADKDGKVSQDEFDGPPDHFAQFDVNQDGFLDPDECPSLPPGMEGMGPKGGPEGKGKGKMPPQ